MSFVAKTNMEDASTFIFRASPIFALKAVHYMGCISHKQKKYAGEKKFPLEY